MTVAIIQARTSSKRLPNKVMKKINNQPLISYVYNRVKRSKKITKIIIACSKLRSGIKVVCPNPNKKVVDSIKVMNAFFIL